MDIQDKYGIQEAIDRHFSNQRVLEVSDRLFALKSIGAIWVEVYIKMPLKDTEDKDIHSLIEAIKTIFGESPLKTQLSCGLFQQLKLTLTHAHGIWRGLPEDTISSPNTGQGVGFQPDWMQKWRQISSYPLTGTSRRSTVVQMKRFVAEKSPC